MKANPTVIIRDEGMRTRVVQHITALNIDKPWAITIEPHKERRSLSQNALMWKWINEVAQYVHEATGQDSDDVHEFFKAKFLPPRIVELGGEIIEWRTTTRLTTAEMSEYMNKIYAWVTTELGLLLPVPQDWAA